MVNKMLTDEALKEINKNSIEALNNYSKTMKYMSADVPLEVLCLDSATLKALNSSGCLRVYDLFDRDLVEIEGLSESRLRHLTSSLNEFLAIC